MHKLSLKNKIIIILALPILAILFFSGETLIKKLEEKRSIEITKNYLELSLLSTKLLNSLQDEREYSLLFVDSYGKLNTNELTKNRDITNENIKKIQKFLLGFDSNSYSKDVTKKLKI